MKTKYILLIVGILGIIASIIGLLKEQNITTHLIGFVCGVSLILGYFELNKKENEVTKTQ